MKFRRKPTVIEAIQYNGENEQEVYAVFGSSGFEVLGDSESFMLVFTTAGGDTIYARPGTWITSDIAPETFYPITQEALDQNYEVFSYTPELSETSTGPEVFTVVREKLRSILPESQVAIACAVMEDHGMLEGGVPSDG